MSQAVMDQFYGELEAQKKELDKAALIVGNLPSQYDDEDEDDARARTLDQLQALPKAFVPKLAMEYYATIADELGSVGWRPGAAWHDLSCGIWHVHVMTPHSTHAGMHTILHPPLPLPPSPPPPCTVL